MPPSRKELEEHLRELIWNGETDSPTADKIRHMLTEGFLCDGQMVTQSDRLDLERAQGAG